MSMLNAHTEQVAESRDPDEPDDAAAERVARSLDPARIDALLADAEASGIGIDGPNGLISQMIKAVLERGLEVEMADHLGYDRGDRAGVGSGNSRNGFTSKTVITTAGQARIDVPRDRDGSFDPQLVPKRKRRLGSTTEMILSLYARGMTTRDIKAHLAEVYGVDVSHETVAKVTDVVVEEVRAWQARPVDEVYPIVFVDGIRIKVRDGGTVTNKVAHLVVGVDVEGFKHALGIWVQAGEGSKFWLGVFTELRNRGLKDALIVCCDGLTGLPDAITRDLAAGDRADLRRAPAPGLAALRRLRPEEEPRRRTQTDLRRAEHPSSRSRVRGLQNQLRPSKSRCDRRLGTSLGRVRALPTIPT
jgi:putative transposase